MGPVVKFTLINHGLKKGAPPKADLYLDCRGVIDHAQKVGGTTAGGLIMPGSGSPLDDIRQVNGWTITSFLAIIHEALHTIPTRRRTEKDPFDRPIVLCFLCAYGVNRSKNMKLIIAEELRKNPNFNVEVQ